jgi:hypothetical protein
VPSQEETISGDGFFVRTPVANRPSETGTIPMIGAVLLDRQAGCRSSGHGQYRALDLVTHLSPSSIGCRYITPEISRNTMTDLAVLTVVVRKAGGWTSGSKDRTMRGEMKGL